MNEDFVSFELAKKLKDKGFKEKCLYNYRNNGCLMPGYVHPINGEFTSDGAYGCCNDLFTDDTCDAPTISQVLKWLREEKKIHVATGVTPKSLWRYVIMFCDNRGLKEPTITVMNYSSYSSAISAGIEYVIDNLI